MIRVDATATFAAKVIHRPAYERGSIFWRSCRAALKNPDFNKLLTSGYCFHKFPNGQDILLTLRAQQLGSLTQVNIDAVDPGTKTVIGILDLQIFAGRGSELPKAEIHQMIIMPQTGFTTEAQAALMTAGFTAEEILPYNFVKARWSEGQVAFWIREGHRNKDKSGLTDLSHVLMSTAVRIVKGSGINEIVLDEVGEPDFSQDILIRYYSTNFGAQVTDEHFGEMVIKI